MKKTAIILAMFLSVFIMTGCGQEMDVTIYNATGINSTNGWIAINAHTQANDEWILPTNYATSDEDCDSTNSFTYKVKENDILEIGGNGVLYIDDGSGNISESEFTLPTGEKTLYGDLLSTPHWYAAVNMDSIVFYKK